MTWHSCSLASPSFYIYMCVFLYLYIHLCIARTSAYFYTENTHLYISIYLSIYLSLSFIYRHNLSMCIHIYIYIHLHCVLNTVEYTVHWCPLINWLFMSREMFWEMFGTEAAAQKPTRSITDNAKLQGLEKTCDEARATKPQSWHQRIGCRP